MLCLAKHKCCVKFCHCLNTFHYNLASILMSWRIHTSKYSLSPSRLCRPFVSVFWVCFLAQRKLLLYISFVGLVFVPCAYDKPDDIKRCLQAIQPKMVIVEEPDIEVVDQVLLWLPGLWLLEIALVLRVFLCHLDMECSHCVKKLVNNWWRL